MTSGQAPMSTSGGPPGPGMVHGAMPMGMGMPAMSSTGDMSHLSHMGMQQQQPPPPSTGFNMQGLASALPPTYQSLPQSPNLQQQQPASMPIHPQLQPQQQPGMMGMPQQHQQQPQQVPPPQPQYDPQELISFD